VIVALFAAQAAHGAGAGAHLSAARPFAAGSDEGGDQPFLRAQPMALAKTALRERRDGLSPASKVPPAIAFDKLCNQAPTVGAPVWSLGQGAGVVEPLPSSRCPRGPPAASGR
jgi:hypothetical protein